MFNSESLESVPSFSNGPRSQSVTSIHTSTPNTPTYEELQSKLETSNRNMVHIKEQQQELLRIQQAAKNHLLEMEQLRAQDAPLSFNTTGAASSAPPNYDNVEEVTQDVTALMTRMKTLTDFIHNQNDLASSLGLDEKSEMIAEQTQLQNKLSELKNKKQQMAYLVNELQSMNMQASDSSFEDHLQQITERTSEVTDVPENRVDSLEDDDEAVDEDEAEEEDDHDGENDYGATQASGVTLQDKIAEINSMKVQLKRLQDMMHTVKLIEIKNGDYLPDDDASDDANEPAASVNESQSQDCLDEEREMAERVRLLQSMTNDLRIQAVSLAAERDRLKDIKNEMSRRREFDGSEKNCKQRQQQLTLPNVTQKEQAFETNDSAHTRKNDDANIAASYSHLGDKRVLNESPHNRKEMLSSSQAEPSHILYTPNNWSAATHHIGSSTSSIRSDNVACNPTEEVSSKTRLIVGNQDKGTADSGAADVLNVSIGAASSQSCSSRGFSVPPPMRNISGRESAWQKTPQETAHVSPLNNQASAPYENQADQNCSYYWGFGQAYGSNAPQNPYCSNPYYHHHTCMPSMNMTSSNDPMVMQQFIQTQQMLINSMSQCNQLLWEQQREINALNSAVVSLQDRLLSSSSMVDAQSAYSRAESVPPNVVCTNQAPFLPRAQSEQPIAANYAVPRTLPPTAMSPSSFRQYPSTTMPTPVQHTPSQYYRNNHRFRQPMLNCGRNSHYAGVAIPFYESDQLQYANNFVNTHNPTTSHMNDSLNNASVNNLHQQNLTHTASNSASNHNATNNGTALNNQVAPGIRANNYYDNFRSYSRQNLLSSSSCKSNDVPDTLHVTHNNLPLTIGNKFRNQINQQNTPPDVLNVNQQRYYHDVLDNFTINANANNLKSAAGSSVTGAGYSTIASGPAGTVSMAYGSTSNIATVTGSNVAANANSTNETSNLIHSIVNNINNNHSNENRCADDQKSINSNNFDVNELKQPKMTSKTLQKGSTGGSKRTRSSHEMTGLLTYNERDTAETLSSTNGANQFIHDSNLTNNKQQLFTKSAPKLTDDLKEYVYREVSALLAANETRPHFLINLFRELQLISSSDPMRKQLMQTFEHVHAQYYEQNGPSTNMLNDAHSSSTLNIQNDLENPHHDLVNGGIFVGMIDANQSTPSTSGMCLPDIRSTANDDLNSIISDIIERNEPSLCSILDLTAQQHGSNIASVALSRTNELAEADQESIPQTLMGLQPTVDIEIRANSLDDTNESIGAVGGVDLSPLPDLAKVSSPTTEY